MFFFKKKDYLFTYLNVSKIIVKSTNFPSNGTTREVGGIISANRRKNTVKDKRMDMLNDTWNEIVVRRMRNKKNYYWFIHSVGFSYSSKPCHMREKKKTSQKIESSRNFFLFLYHHHHLHRKGLFVSDVPLKLKIKGEVLIYRRFLYFLRSHETEPRNIFLSFLRPH